MKTRIFITLVAFAAASAAFADIDLTPIPGELSRDGVVMHLLKFRTGSDFVRYTPPLGWQASGGGSSLTLIPPKAVQTEAKITVSGKADSGDWDDAAIKQLREETLKSVPKKAENVKLVGDQKNPVVLNRHQTYEVTVSYTSDGQPFKKSVLVCNFADEQLRFQIIARSGDFAALHADFISSLFLWDGLK